MINCSLFWYAYSADAVQRIGAKRRCVVIKNVILHGCSQGGTKFSHRVAFEYDFMSRTYESIQGGIGEEVNHRNKTSPLNYF